MTKSITVVATVSPEAKRLLSSSATAKMIALAVLGTKRGKQFTVAGQSFRRGKV